MARKRHGTWVGGPAKLRRRCGSSFRRRGSSRQSLITTRRLLDCCFRGCTRPSLSTHHTHHTDSHTSHTSKAQTTTMAGRFVRASKYRKCSCDRLSHAHGTDNGNQATSLARAQRRYRPRAYLRPLQANHVPGTMLRQPSHLQECMGHQPDQG